MTFDIPGSFLKNNSLKVYAQQHSIQQFIFVFSNSDIPYVLNFIISRKVLQSWKKYFLVFKHHFYYHKFQVLRNIGNFNTNGFALTVITSICNQALFNDFGKNCSGKNDSSYQGIRKIYCKITFTVLHDMFTCFGTMLERSNASGNDHVVESILALIVKNIEYFHQHVDIYGFHH